MQCDIMKHANQLRRKVRVVGYEIRLLLHRCCNLKILFVEKFHQKPESKNCRISNKIKVWGKMWPTCSLWP
jgi:hypothetical protein